MLIIPGRVELHLQLLQHPAPYIPVDPDAGRTIQHGLYRLAVTDRIQLASAMLCQRLHQSINMKCRFRRVEFKPRRPSERKRLLMRIQLVNETLPVQPNIQVHPARMI